MRRVALGIFVWLVASISASAATDVQIAQGALSGTVDDGIASFKGIPFAAPPVAELRWRAPQPASAWSGVRDASAFGFICPPAKLSVLAKLKPHLKLPQSEDCLTLNVWSPAASPNAKLPVMVWIYGGSFRNGSSAYPLYDGVELAKHDVIVVSFNYRLGRLGFFDLPALAAEHPGEATGNFGLLDQIAALAWVKRNIEAFGGDPNNVTIFGESAGGMSVNDLMVSPLARGLFAKAISESGLGFGTIPTTAEAQFAATAFAERESATGSSQLATLRSLSVDQILDDEANSTVTSTAPMIDGTVIADQPTLLFAQGKMAHVPYLTGSNSDEATLMPEFGTTSRQTLDALGDQLAFVRKAYEQEGTLNDDEFGRQIFGDFVFASGAQGLASFAARNGAPAYVYHFDYIADAQRAISEGVGHGGELPYIFGVSGLSRMPGMSIVTKFVTSKDLGIVAMMQDYWTNFARTGNPNGQDLPEWAPTSAAKPQTLVVNDATKTVEGFRKAQIAIAYAGWLKRAGIPVPN
jgi:para-nitrobenzyl esterase